MAPRDATTAANRQVPSDRALPGLSTLLDRPSIQRVLAPHLLDACGEILECRPQYVRYKPGTSCLASYSVTCETAGTSEPADILLYGKCYAQRDFDNALEKANEKRWVDIAGVPPFVALPKRRILIYMFPNDRDLAGLRIISTPKKIQRILYEHLPGYSEGDWRISDRRFRVTTVRYKPEKRAVFRITTRAIHRSSGTKKPLTVYMRFYCDDRGEALFDLMRDLYAALGDQSAVAVPQPLVYLPKKHALLMAKMDGEPAAEVITGSGGRGAAERAARAIAVLHALAPSGLPKRSTSDLMRDAHATGKTLAHIAPAIEQLATELLEKLDSLSRAVRGNLSCFVHGDYHHGQILLSESRDGVLDFDRSYIGDPLADVGNFCANVRMLRVDKRMARSDVVENAFVEAYAAATGGPVDSRCLKFWTALGIFQLAVRPFRTLQSNWTSKIHRLLRECMDVLA